MNIDLTENETQALIQTLEERLRELRQRNRPHLDPRLQSALKDRERVLQCLHDKIVTCHALDAA